MRIICSPFQKKKRKKKEKKRKENGYIKGSFPLLIIMEDKMRNELGMLSIVVGNSICGHYPKLR
jgi:hypothetical protein